MLRRLVTTFALLLTASACALAPRGAEERATEAAREPQAAGWPLDLAGKSGPSKEDKEEEEGDADERELPNAKYHLELEADELGPPRAEQILRAQAQRRAIERDAQAAPRPKAAGLEPSQWQALGPSNVGGRVRSIAFDPRNANRIFAGTASGGLWLSRDSGNSWHAIQDFMPNLSVTTVVLDPTNPDVMYLGTGEASQGLVGVGAFKSVDAGATWQLLPATLTDANADWRFVNRLAIHPTQPSILLAALTNENLATGAIYRSSDAGGSWTRVAGLKALDIGFDPNTPSNAVAGLDDGTIAYSRDAGLSWARTTPLVASPSGRQKTARAEIAFARSQPGVVYASVDNNKGEVWRSNDAGASWQLIATPQHLNKQGDYANSIWVDPADANHVVAAGLDVYQSLDGGVTFSKVSDWKAAPSSPHGDHHALVSPPSYGASNPALFDGNDGGIYRTGNIFAAASTGEGWMVANDGLAATQFYSGGGRTSAGGRIVGGTQDNGSLMLSQNMWRAFRGGDGGMVAVDPASDQTIFGEYAYLAIHRSMNGGLSSSYICQGISEALPAEEGVSTFCGTGATQKANFIAPFVLDPSNANRLLAGANSLWVSDNARAATVTWRTIKDPAPPSDNFINAIAVAEANSNVVWVGHNNGALYRSLDALAAVPTWRLVGQGVIPARRVQRITIDRDDPNRVIVSLTGFVANNVWETLDAGLTWSSITANLPFAPVFDVKRHASNSNWLYAATSVGVFTSENHGATWSTTNEGPANVRVRQLFWIDNGTLGAATFGRGMYKVAVPAGGPANYQDLWWAGPQENGWGMSITQHGAMLFAALYIYDTQGQPVWAVLPGGTWNAAFTAFSGALYLPSGSWFANYDTTRFMAGAPAGSATITFTGPASATLTYSLNGVSGSKAIVRQGFGAQNTSLPVAAYGDLWWGGAAQNGWGVAINQQYRTLFSVWYTYDANGRTVWYVVPGGSWSATNAYTGTAYRTTSSAWLGTAYNAAAFVVQPVGRVTFNFTDFNNAVMSYVIDGVSGSMPITRQPF